jgi:hypothetical protein
MAFIAFLDLNCKSSERRVSRWRAELFKKSAELALADLGSGVLDDANVYASAYFAGKAL